MIDCKYLFLGHHKCASTYVAKILSSFAKQLNMSVNKVDLSDQLSSVTIEYSDFFYVLNANRKIVEKSFSMEKIKSLHVIRDPRDVIVSAYYSHRNSHPTDIWPDLVPHRERLNSLDKNEGLMAEMDFSQQFFDDMDSWVPDSSPDILDVKMEDFTLDPYSKWVEIIDFFGFMDSTKVNKPSFRGQLRQLFDILKSRMLKQQNDSKIEIGEVLETVYSNRFEILSKGRRPGMEDVQHHYRKGQPGDWRNHFTERHKKSFKERFNNLLIKYNYEVDDNW
ncbi:MAG: sulfotransferase domain-containing protein [Cyclobacteriaceae bacterium]|jgi:hypothetical protein|nr:sulfotransferase domain-containing protein [Cyclobacteriaceae bacterium]